MVRLQYPTGNNSTFTGMELSALIKLITDSAQTATGKILGYISLPNTIKKAQAIRMYGRRNVERWLAEGLIKADHNKINRKQIAGIASISNRLSYRKVNATRGSKLQKQTRD